MKHRQTQGSLFLPTGKGIFTTCSTCVARPTLGG